MIGRMKTKILLNTLSRIWIQKGTVLKISVLWLIYEELILR